MKFVPRTLFARTFLIVGILIAVTVGAWITLFRIAEREPRARQLAQLTVSVVHLTRAALVNADPTLRRDLLRDLSEREGLRLYPAEADDRTEPLPDERLFSLMRAEAQAQLGRDTRFARSVNGLPGLWVSFRIEDGDSDDIDEYWLMLPEERAADHAARDWLLWGAAALALALAVAWLIVSRVTRPLRALAAAAHEVGRGRRPEPLAERGAEELRELAAAFNRMAGDLARLDAERAEVLAGISHDLRTPLARLRLEAEMSVADDAARRGIAADIDQMDAMLGQFLDFARGEESEALESIDPNTLLVTIADRYAGRGRPLALATTPLPALPLRRRALDRALTNLVENGAKYAGEAIELESSRQGNVAILAVLDRGPGIPAEQADRLKQPFTRFEAARSGAGGTGLGLAIVDRVARAHGGELRLLPREGGGLRAEIRLPLPDASGR